MGRRSATETLGRVLVALLEERRIQQSSLARRAGVDGETVRATMLELKASGVPVEREMEGRAVIWSVADGWFPNGVLFEGEHAQTLLRLLLRLRPSKDRDAAIDRLAGAASSAKQIRDAKSAIVASVPAADAAAEDFLGALERAAIGRYVVRVRYQSVHDLEPRWRDCSVQRIVANARPFAIAWCHQSQELKHYRPERISAVMPQPAIAFHAERVEEVDRQQSESMNGFRGGELVEVSFVVRSDAWPWVRDNLPFQAERIEPAANGTRVTVRTKGGEVLERYLVGLADRVTIETRVVRDAVVILAKRALLAHGEVP
jgi:predicted DNA-binding transcriptional regulator YafY